MVVVMLASVVDVSPTVAIVAKSPESAVNMERSDSRASFTLADKFEFARIVFNWAILESVSDFTLEADSLISSSGVAAVVRLLLVADPTVVPVEPVSCPWLVFREVLDAVLCRVVQKEPIFCPFALTSPSSFTLTASFSVLSNDRKLSTCVLPVKPRSSIKLIILLTI